jgi:stringent starvation protein B
MTELSTKPYLVRAIYEWCVDSGFTPYLSVVVDEHTLVPREHVKNGEIILNIGPAASRNLLLGNDEIQFSSRFNGVSQNLLIPMYAVATVFAKENGQGLVFPKEMPKLQANPAAHSGKPTATKHGEAKSGPKRGKPSLQVVK